MTPRRLYALHRWLSALAFLQLAVWTGTGLFFAAVSMDSVHGAHVEGAHDWPIGPAPGALTPTSALACFAAGGMDPSRLELRATPAGLFYVARSHDAVLRLDARTCAGAPVEQEEAELTAQRDQPGAPPVKSAERIEKAGVEYRGKPLPAWRVALADETGTVVYVDARTGEVTARRNDLWRTYDFLWSLHIMNYGSREGFHHPLLIAAASLAVVTVMSGVALWALRIARWVGKRRSPGPAKPPPERAETS